MQVKQYISCKYSISNHASKAFTIIIIMIIMIIMITTITIINIIIIIMITVTFRCEWNFPSHANRAFFQMRVTRKLR
jgi:hypothetical protein